MKKICDMDSVRWMPKEEITFVASNLLENYEECTGQEVTPPIPIEAIIERFLNIRLEYDDLKARFGLPDILGATWIKEKRIVIDRSLLEGEHRGRMFFTMAHEIGHWCIHRQAFIGPAARRSWAPQIVCRESGARARGEWQADYFAASLLMPEMPVREAFAEIFGFKPIAIYNQKSIAPRTLFWLDLAWEHAGEIARAVIEKGRFTNVSKAAMRIRLQELGLLVNRTCDQLAAAS
jgi:Zn-dependent peptidase ImmA (M78 family)